MAKQEFELRHLRLKSAFPTSGAPGLGPHPSPRATSSLWGVTGKDGEQRDGAVEGDTGSYV